MESVIVPYIAEIRAKKEPACRDARGAGRDVGDFVGRVLVTSGVGLLILAGVFVLVIKPILGVVTRFDTEAINLIYWLLVETAPLIILLVWTSVLAGTLNAYKKFAWPALSPAFRAIVNLTIIFAFKNTWGVHAIAWGYVVGELVRLCILTGIIYKLHLFPLRLSLRLTPKLREFLRTSSYQVIAFVVLGLNLIVDKVMASWLGSGSVSILEYAGRLYMIPVTFLSAGLFRVVLTHWSQDYYQYGLTVFAPKVRKVSKTVLLLSLMVFLFLVLFRHLLVQIAYARGKFALECLPIVEWTFVCYLFGLMPYIAGSMFTQAHLVLKNTAFLRNLALLNFILNISLNYLLMRLLGISGIALSTSITVSIIAIILFISFLKKK